MSSPTLGRGRRAADAAAVCLCVLPLVLVACGGASSRPPETARTAELFKSLAGRHSLVVVEHDMAFVEQLGGRVTVLHEGSVLAEGDLATVQNDPRVIEVYLGR